MWDCRSLLAAYITGVRHSLGTPAPWLTFKTAPQPRRLLRMERQAECLSSADVTDLLTAQRLLLSHNARAAVWRLLVCTLG
jgi:hypothetical protein